jgi:hypothetical protein
MNEKFKWSNYPAWVAFKYLTAGDEMLDIVNDPADSGQAFLQDFLQHKIDYDADLARELAIWATKMIDYKQLEDALWAHSTQETPPHDH